MIATRQCLPESSNLTRLIREETKMNSRVIEQFIKSLRYPATKQEIIDQARDNTAPESVMAFYVYRLPERMYRNPSDISFTAFASAYFFGQD